MAFTYTSSTGFPLIYIIPEIALIYISVWYTVEIKYQI